MGYLAQRGTYEYREKIDIFLKNVFIKIDIDMASSCMLATIEATVIKLGELNAWMLTSVKC